MMSLQPLLLGVTGVGIFLEGGGVEGDADGIR